MTAKRKRTPARIAAERRRNQRQEQIGIRLDPDQARKLDELRGELSRAAWLTALALRALDDAENIAEDS